MNIISNTCNIFLFFQVIQQRWRVGVTGPSGRFTKRGRRPRGRTRGGGGTRGAGGPPARLQVSEEAEPVTPLERVHEEEEEEEEAPFDEQEALAGGMGSSSSAPRVYL